MDKLEGAILFAFYAHRGQKRRNGEPYFLHLTRVVQNTLDLYDDTAKKYQKETGELFPVNKEDAAVIAVLHDVIEDTDVSHIGLQSEFGTDITFYVQILSRINILGQKPTYESFINRIASYPVATLVKKADLMDNMRDGGPNVRYIKAWEVLNGTKNKAGFEYDGKK